MSIRNLQGLLSADDSGLFVPALGYSQSVSSSSCSVSGSRPSSVASAPAGRVTKRRSRVVKRVRFEDDLVGPSVLHKEGYPFTLRKEVPWVAKGWTPRYMVNLWSERMRYEETEYGRQERDFWFDLGFQWGWNVTWFLSVARKSLYSPSADVGKPVEVPFFLPGSHYERYAGGQGRMTKAARALVGMDYSEVLWDC